MAIVKERKGKADTSILPNNGELLLSYWKRIGGRFDGGFLIAAKAAAENHGFYYERGHVYHILQLTMEG